MRLGSIKSTDLAILTVLCVVALVASPKLAAHTAEWQEGKLIESEPLDGNHPASANLSCLLLRYAIHTVETQDLMYKFIGNEFEFVLVPDRNRLKFKIWKDGRVALQDKKGNERQTSLRLYAQEVKVSRAVAPLSPKAKRRNWRVADVARMQPVLISLPLPWLPSVPEPPCSLPFVFIRGWAFELDSDGMAYEVVQRGPDPPAMTVSIPVRIADKGKNEVYVLDQAGKERKFRFSKKTIQNPGGS